MRWALSLVLLVFLVLFSCLVSAESVLDISCSDYVLGEPYVYDHYIGFNTSASINAQLDLTCADFSSYPNDPFFSIPAFDTLAEAWINVYGGFTYYGTPAVSIYYNESAVKHLKTYNISRYWDVSPVPSSYAMLDNFTIHNHTINSSGGSSIIINMSNSNQGDWGNMYIYNFDMSSWYWFDEVVDMNDFDHYTKEITYNESFISYDEKIFIGIESMWFNGDLYDTTVHVFVYPNSTYPSNVTMYLNGSQEINYSIGDMNASIVQVDFSDYFETYYPDGSDTTVNLEFDFKGDMIEGVTSYNVYLPYTSIIYLRQQEGSNPSEDYVPDVDDLWDLITSGSTFAEVAVAWNPSVYPLLVDTITGLFSESDFSVFPQKFVDLFKYTLMYVFREPASLVSYGGLNG